MAAWRRPEDLTHLALCYSSLRVPIRCAISARVASRLYEIVKFLSPNAKHHRITDLAILGCQLTLSKSSSKHPYLSIKPMTRPHLMSVILSGPLEILASELDGH